MQSNGPLRFLLVTLVFSLTFLSRVPLVDAEYEYSFEPDSKACVENVRSMYFFFKNPVKENCPHPISAYPTYFDGQNITASLFAMAISSVAKNSELLPSLSDSNKSIFIFSMRWSSVLLDSFTAVIVFMILCSISANVFISFAVAMLYFMLNLQLLQVDLVRVDHYVIFAVTFALWAAIQLFLFPEKKRFVLMCGVSFGLVAATKLNFPFYMIMTFFTVTFLMFKRKLPRLNLTILIIFSLVSLMFMFQRWLMYPENIIGTIKEIVNVGTEWALYWGNEDYDYYHWTQFFGDESNHITYFILLTFYASLLYVFLKAVITRNMLLVLLSITFLVQSLILIYSPKVGRYGVLIPVWVSIFTGIGITALQKYLTKNTSNAALLAFTFVPMTIYSITNYKAALTHAENRTQSIKDTRLAAAEWIVKNIKSRSTITIQHPEESNPPVFLFPYKFDEGILKNRFLNKKEFCAHEPPDLEQLRQTSNALIITDKEVKYHLQTFNHRQCANENEKKWRVFFNSLPLIFAHQCFTSEFENYGVKSYCVYKLSDSSSQNKIISKIRAKTTVDSLGSKIMTWSYYFNLGENPGRFQIEIAEDSKMRWLVYGSRRGFGSKYRLNTRPQQIYNNKSYSFIPIKVAKALENGWFSEMLGDINPATISVSFETLFSSIFREMHEQNITFEESVRANLQNEKDAEVFIDIVYSLYYPEYNIKKAKVNDYERITGVKTPNPEAFLKTEFKSVWEFDIPRYLDKNKRYYWRVRAREQNRILSEWSNIAIL